MKLERVLIDVFAVFASIFWFVLYSCTEYSILR